MKKTSILLALSFVCGSAFAVHEKYEEGYVFVPSVVNTESDEVAISYLGDKVIYSKFDKKGKYKIYQAAVNDTIELQDTVDVPELRDLGIYGTVAYDAAANKIYYSKYEKKTKDYMLYESTNEGGKWSKGKRLNIKGIGKYRKSGSTLVNAGWLYRAPGISGFLNPNLAQGGNRIYFTSQFSSGKGGRDIWFIDKISDKQWSMPQNIGDSINSKSDQDYAFCSGDSLLYFASKDSSNVFNLFVAHKVGEDWGDVEMLDSVYNSSANDYNLIGNEKGLFFISSRNSGNGEDIYRPSQIPEVEEQLAPFPWKLFNFDFDRDLFKSEQQLDLDSLYNTMLVYMDKYDFVVKGHTDTRGSDEYNQKLSVKRANRIRTLLIQKGIPAEKMKIVGYGESMPLIPNAQTEEEHAQNRRVEVDVIPLPETEAKSEE
ncbi:MAG: OmpA family protein [Bacteroidales bacterium]|nr:OmpA family protein [Bacteroidales bacterium]